MTNSPYSAMNEIGYYRILVSGCVSEWWVNRYLDVKTLIAHLETGSIVTEMTGKVSDQDALMGLLNMLYDMRHILISVEQLSAAQYEELVPEE